MSVTLGLACVNITAASINLLACDWAYLSEAVVITISYSQFCLKQNNKIFRPDTRNHCDIMVLGMLKIYFFGKIEILDTSGEIVKLTTPTKHLLAYLWSQRGQKPRRMDAGRLIWPVPDEKRLQLQGVRQALSKLKSTLHPHTDVEVLQATREFVWFNTGSDCWIDIEHFYALLEQARDSGPDAAISLREEAIKLSGGHTFIGGCHDINDDVDHEWCYQENDKLSSEYAKTLGKLIDAYVARSSHEDVIRCGELYLKSNRSDENIYRAIMYAAYSLGNQSLTDRWIQKLHDMLLEAGLETPMPETTALLDSIRTGRTADEIAAMNENALRWLKRYPKLVTPFVGRNDDLSRIIAAWEGVKTGPGASILISGEPGVGKTELARRALDLTNSDGAHTWEGSCQDSNFSKQFEPWVGALDRAFRDKEIPGRVIAEIGEMWLAELGKYIPYLFERFPELEPAPTLHNPEEEARRISEAFLRSLEMLSRERPIAILLDDLHWAHETSLDLHMQVIRRLEQLPIMILATTRPEGLIKNHPLATHCDSMIKEQQLEHIALDLLTKADVETIVTGMLRVEGPTERPQQLVELLMTSSDGNPLIVESSIQWFVQSQVLLMQDENWQIDHERLAKLDPPPRIEAQVRARLRGLSPQSRELIELASTRTGRFDEHFLEALIDQSPGELISMLEELQANRLLRDEENALVFHHAIYREAIATTLSNPKLRSHHRRVGQALELLHKEAKRGYGPEIVPELAEHFFQAGMEEKALQYALMAGESVWEKSYAKRDALLYFDRALGLALELKDEQSEMRAYKGIGEVCAFTDEQDRGLEYCERALEICEDPEARAEIYLALAYMSHVKRDLDEGLAYCERALDELNHDCSSELHVRVLAEMSSFLNWSKQHDRAADLCAQALVFLADSRNDILMSQVLAERGHALSSKGEHEAAESSLLKSGDLATKIGDIYSAGFAYAQLSVAYERQAKLDKSILALEYSYESFQSLSARYDELAVISNRLCYAHLREKQFDIALHYAQVQLSSFQHIGQEETIAMAHGMLGCIYEARNELSEASTHFAKAKEIAKTGSSMYRSIIIVCLFLDRIDLAIEYLKKGIGNLSDLHRKTLSAELSDLHETAAFPKFRAHPDVRRLLSIPRLDGDGL